jgi:hypothetical protein
MLDYYLDFTLLNYHYLFFLSANIFVVLLFSQKINIDEELSEYNID